jgi:hypothetical protein
MQTKDHGVHLGKILDSVVHFRNQVRHNALNPQGEGMNAQVGMKQSSNPTSFAEL